MRTLPFVLLLTLGLCHGLFAKVVYVDDNASAGGDGTSWASAHKYLQDALADVNASDEIWVAEGTYKPDQGAGITEGNRTVSFNLVNGVGMYGGFKGAETTRTPLGDGNQTILSGEINADKTFWSIHVVMGNGLGASTVLDSLTITNGNANGQGAYGYGGGMYLKNSSPTLSNCTFTNNSGVHGGGMCNESSSSPTLTNCTFTGNSPKNGGGMYNISSSPTLTNCTFANNSASSAGGGMYNSSSSSPTLTNCTFTNNSASSAGGGMYNISSSPTIANCVFSGNAASHGGGMYNTGPGRLARQHGSSPTLTNCVFIGNSASSHHLNRGGGMYNYNSSSPTLTNCTFTGNSASYTGGGMYNNESSYPTLHNCILWKNLTNGSEGHGSPGSSHEIVLEAAVAAEYPGDPNAKDAVYLTLNILQGWTQDGRAISEDPLFNNPDNPIGPDGKWFTADDGLRVKTGSPAIDAGYNASLSVDRGDVDDDGDRYEIVPLDLAGFVRVQNGKVDFGAYEYGGSRIPTFIVSLTSNPSNAGSSTGDGAFDEGNSATISATPNTGYLFTGWSGDATGTTNPLTITVDAAKTITANFAQDLNDTDGDGLSNYAELVTHLTKADDNDTDDDGLLDNEEIQIGTNPKSSDATLVNYLNSKAATRETNARTNALAEGRTTGVVEVKAKPSDYGLFSESDLNASVDSAVATARTSALSEGKEQGQATGINAVKAKPSDYGLFAAADVNASVVASRNAGLAEGRTTGIAAVKDAPSEHGLYTQADLNASAASVRTAGIAEGRSTGIEEGKEQGRSEGQATGIAAVKADPSAYGLVTKDAYDQMVEQLINSSGSSSTTPYTDGWHYYPSRGWMWTNRTSYPYFYDSSTKAWMYFKSGEDKPRFYHYGTKAWVTLGE